MIQYPQLNDLVIRKDFVCISTVGFLVHCLKTSRFAQSLQLSSQGDVAGCYEVSWPNPVRMSPQSILHQSSQYDQKMWMEKKKNIYLGMDFTTNCTTSVWFFFFLKLLYLEVSINITIIFILPWDFYNSTLANMDSTFQKILWQT